MTQETAPDAATVRALIRHYNAVIDELQEELVRLEHGSAGSRAQRRAAPAPSLSSRVARTTRSAVRRAARRAPASGVVPIWVAQPIALEPGANAGAGYAGELAAARQGVWGWTAEVESALRTGNFDAARAVAEDMLRTEEAIQATVDSVELPPQWRSLAGRLGAASDTVIDGTRALIATIERDGTDGSADEALTKIRSGQSIWLKAWPAFVQVIPARYQ